MKNSILFVSALLIAGFACAEEGVASETKGAVERGAEATVRVVKKGLTAAGNGIKRGAEAAGHGIEVGLNAAGRGVKRGAEATEHGMNKVADKLSPSSGNAKP